MPHDNSIFLHWLIRTESFFHAEVEAWATFWFNNDGLWKLNPTLPNFFWLSWRIFCSRKNRKMPIWRTFYRHKIVYEKLVGSSQAKVTEKNEFKYWSPSKLLHFLVILDYQESVQKDQDFWLFHWKVRLEEKAVSWTLDAKSQAGI